MKCDFCKEEYNKCDLKPVLVYRTKYICYKCLARGNAQVREMQIKGMEKNKKVGTK